MTWGKNLRATQMNSKFKYLGALAGLALAQTAPAQQISKPLSSLASNSVTGHILCRGGSNVPMTADAEQSLPLRVVAHLDCGQEVSLLSNSEGYTVNVHTADGKTGFVAWMNVAKGAPTVVRKSVLQSASVHNGIATWVAGTPGSERFYSEGLMVESLTVNGVTVQVSLQDTGWKLLANVAVNNGSLQAINLVPARMTLDDLNGEKSLRYQEPKKLRGAVNHQILWTTSNASPSDAGYLANSYASPNSSPSSTQNYLAEHQATVQLVSEHRAAFNPHSQMNNVALRETAVLPNQQISGSSWFQRDGKRQDMVLSVPVDGVTYVFPLAFNHEKQN
jgi:hypothetical protein